MKKKEGHFREKNYRENFFDYEKDVGESHKSKKKMRKGLDWSKDQRSESSHESHTGPSRALFEDLGIKFDS
jgi:hypothetical protein